MTTTGHSGSWTPDRGRCRGCNAPLAKDNTASLCGQCHREQRDALRTPPAHLRQDFFETDDFSAAFDAHHIGHAIKAYRTHPRWTKLYGRALKQETVGRWLGLNQAQVSRVENGKPEKNLDTLRAYAETLHFPRHRLWFLFPGESRLILPASIVDNKGDLGDIDGNDGILVADPAGMASFFVSGEASMLDVASLNDARNHFEVMYRNLGGPVTQDRLTRFLSERVSPLLAQAQSQGNPQQLYRATGGLVALAGVCAYDSENHGAAQRHFQDALRLAGKAGDSGFRAYVLALIVNQAIALGDSRRAIGLSELALKVDESLSGALQADLYGMQAKAYAQLRDTEATYRSMSLAEASAAGIDSGVGPAEIGYIQKGLTEAHFVDALTELGDLVPAQRYSEQIFSIPTHARGRVNRLASLATLELRLGEAERASALISEMVDSAQGMESRRLNTRFRAIRSSLNNLSSVDTSNATEQIDRFLTISPW
ncbi:hypothetical protein BN6_25960 [Saccharothrix espanaensis DSM 44229]|uniref:HTH cro/C1-type domain-containing protein n=1 Tax=Saccharothrix espanaensis (strain ATCC 51144 / DSM 44229 / JCM 9112 / NBRC 15066 / NRRL 15764) TaxID=1179773 RepID=K0JYZ0_SACES|nr:hypothetical protein BN6_25960 [Saccharothrix espanaensis DSM 44229]